MTERSEYTNEREIAAFLRRQYTAPIATVIAELAAMLGFAPPKRDDTGADWRTVNVDDVLHALVRAYEAGRKAGPAAEPQTCRRCAEVGSVDHDADVAICNLCVDAIHGGADPHRFDPAERMTADQRIARANLDAAALAAKTPKSTLTLEQQYSHLQPEEYGFVDRIVTEIALCNAADAVDNRTARKRDRLRDPITAYLGNCFDTLAELAKLPHEPNHTGINNVRTATLARKIYRAEVKRRKAIDRERSEQRLPAIKACARCSAAKVINWTCRNCGAKCCAHRCGLKTSEFTAVCASCQRTNTGVK